MTANDDRTVPPVTNSIAYYTAMRNAGNDCSLMVWPKGVHGFGFRSTFTYHEQMKSELIAWLNNVHLQNAADKRVACVGNSITDGHGIEMADLRSRLSSGRTSLSTSTCTRSSPLTATT